MILKNKGIDDTTVLKVVRTLIERDQSTRGFRIKTREGTKDLSKEDIIQFLTTAIQLSDEGRYGRIRMCKTCGNFNISKGKRGWCFPKERTLFRDNTEYCSKWTPMTEEQKHTRRALHEKFQIK